MTFPIDSTTENIVSFADDTTVFLSDSDPIRLFSRANKSLEAVFHWFCANRLSLNAKKINIWLYITKSMTPPRSPNRNCSHILVSPKKLISFEPFWHSHKWWLTFNLPMIWLWCVYVGIG